MTCSLARPGTNCCAWEKRYCGEPAPAAFLADRRVFLPPHPPRINASNQVLLLCTEQGRNYFHTHRLVMSLCIFHARTAAHAQHALRYTIPFYFQKTGSKRLYQASAKSPDSPAVRRRGIGKHKHQYSLEIPSVVPVKVTILVGTFAG